MTEANLASVIWETVAKVARSVVAQGHKTRLIPASLYFATRQCANNQTKRLWAR